MSLFDLFNKNQKPREPEGEILLAMPLFTNGDGCQIEKIIEYLASQWNLHLSDITGDENVASFNADGHTIAIAFMQFPVPQGDIDVTAQYAYNWPKAVDELSNHTGHAILTLMHGKKSTIQRFEMLSKVIHAILKTSNAVGVYLGKQSLLIPRKQYIDSMETLEQGELPVTLWVYIGLRNLETGNCAYTYGLKDFNKQEIEIIDSNLSLEELYDFIVNITSYVIGSDVNLKSGETIGISADHKIAITSSKGQFVEGDSIKLAI